MSDLAAAIAFAAAAHRGQTDKTGQPFIGHPLRVMAYVAEEITETTWRWTAEYDAALLYPGREARLRDDTLVAAVLHDTVEDMGLALFDIERRFGPRVRRIVDALTRRPDETYWIYIARCAEDPIARLIKRADIRDNSDPRRQWAGAPLDRYAKALGILDVPEVPA